MSNLVKGIDEILNNEDWFIGVNDERLKDLNTPSTIEANYAAIALAYKGSSGNTALRGNPQAPWCYRVNTKNDTFSSITPSGFEEKPETKPELLTIYDKSSNRTALTGIVGYPVYLEISFGLSPYDKETSTYYNICQVAGYRIKKDGPRVNSLPSVPLTTMYSWGSIDDGKFNEPSDKVISLDPIGTRGKSCIECIKAGESSCTYKGKVERCTAKGFLYVVATHIYNKRKGLTPISEYIDEQGNSLDSIIFCISLGRTSLYGYQNSKTKVYEIVGVEPYINYLKNKYPSNSDGSNHLTLFESVPSKSGGSYYQIHITDMFSESIPSSFREGITLEDEKAGALKARDLWLKLRPQINLQTIQEPIEEQTSNRPLGLEIASAPLIQEDDDNHDVSVEDWTQFKL